MSYRKEIVGYEQHDSDDISTDESTKRKKREENEENEEESFKRSRKIQRTPQKKIQQKPVGDEKLDLILELMKDLKAEMKEIREEQREYREEIRKLKAENNNLKEENMNIIKENKEIKAELKEIKNNMDIMERENKKNNIVMTGFKINTSDSEILNNTVNSFMKNYLGIEIKTKAVRILGPKTCRIELEDESEKMKVMRNKSKLKNMRDEKIFINDDVTKRELERQKYMRRIAREEKEKGKKVKIGYKKLTVDGRRRWDSESGKLETAKN